jgi:hypothetical protein
MSTFTVHQRDLLRHRIERAIAWQRTMSTDKDSIRAVANTIVNELELSGFSAATQRRAIDKVVENLEQTA